MIAKLLKAICDIYEEQGNPDAAYESYLTSLNMFLEIVLRDDHLHDLRVSPEREDLLGKLKQIDLPSVDFVQARSLARAAADAVKARHFGYALFIATKRS